MRVGGPSGPPVVLTYPITASRDCFGGDVLIDVTLPRGVERADLDRVAGAVSREVLDGFPRPFFRIDVPGRFLLTGLLLTTSVRVTVRQVHRNRAADLAQEAARELMGTA